MVHLDWHAKVLEWPPRCWVFWDDRADSVCSSSAKQPARGCVHESIAPGWSRQDVVSQTAVSANNAYLAAKNPLLRPQLHNPIRTGDLPFIVGREPVAEEGTPPLQTDIKLNDAAPFRLSRNHFMIERRDGGYHVRDLRSTLGTIVNGEPIGNHFRTDDALLRVGENQVIAGGVDSPFVFSVFIG